MDNVFQTNLDKLKNDIRLKLNENVEIIRRTKNYYYKVTESELEFYVHAVLARLFALTYGKIYDLQEKTASDDVRVNRYQWMQEQLSSEESSNGSANTDQEDSIRSKIRYLTDKRTQYHFAELEALDRTDIIALQQPDNKRRAIYYDRANFELLDDRDDTFKIIDYIITEKIKTIDHNLLAEAFYKIDKYYNDAKELALKEANTADMTLYIAKWVNMYRLESKLHITWIEKVAEFFVENNYTLRKIKTNNTSGERIEIVANDKLALGELKLNIDNLTFVFGTLTNNNNNFIESWYDIPYYSSTRPYFECTSEQQFDKVIERYLYIRGFLTNTCTSLLSSAREVFEPFIYGSTDAIEVMYKFCKETFPLIETHQNCNLYKIKNTNNIVKITKNEKYIKAARNFMVLFFYKKNIIPMKDIAANVQKNMNKKHSKK